MNLDDVWNYLPIIILVAMVLMKFMSGGGRSANASHILVASDAECAALKTQIEAAPEADRAKVFATLAAQHSTCPSGKSSGGSLGDFSQGAMDPPFDSAVFDDAKTPVNVTIGPVRSRFGYHLILVHSREEPKAKSS